MAAVHALDESRFGYLKPGDVARLAEAYRFSEAAHAGQTRQSGEPYISHPLAVAEILADWHVDSQTLMAALLHDVTEDTSVTKDEISDTFGKPVAELVDGVSKLDRIEFQSAEDAQAENFRKRKLAESKIRAEVYGREKHVYSTYRKMIEKHLSFSEVHDIFGIRVVVPDTATCYLAMGALHALYKPIPGKFKDYIAIPKANGYQSIHTDLIGPYGVPVEVQIRTDQMHRLAESGVASHWLYKDETDKLSDLQKQTHRWLQSLLEIQNQSGDPQEFLEHVKVDLFPDEVYVFTPKGRILSLPRGATTVDFAYMVHTDIGNCTVAAKVNGELVPLRTELRNGDRVEIITASHAKPNPGWLQYVRTAKARSNIRHFLKTMQYEESAGLGERLLDQAIKALNASLAEVDDASWERVVRDGGARSREELLADIGLGKRLPAVVARRLLKRSDSKEDLKTGGSVTIRGTEGMAVQLASCCRPIPGDAIVGSIKKGQGLVVHISECTVIERSRKKEPEQWIDVEWDPRTSRLFQAAI